MPEKKHCKDCHFHVVGGVDEATKRNFGFCYRYPPQLTGNSNASAAPAVGSDITWCGEFVAAPKPAHIHEGQAANSGRRRNVKLKEPRK